MGLDLFYLGPSFDRIDVANLRSIWAELWVGPRFSQHSKSPRVAGPDAA